MIFYTKPRSAATGARIAPRFTIARAVSILAGLASGAGATALLLSDVLKGGAPWTMQHMLMPLVIGLTVTAGHLAGRAARERKLSAAGFLLAFLAGNFITIYNSAGRQAEVRAVKAAAAGEIARQRAPIERQLAMAYEVLDDCPKGREHEQGLKCGLRKAQLAECKSGDGTRCKGVVRSIEVYTAAIKGHRADLEKIGLPPAVDGGAEGLARLAGLFGADEDRVKDAASVLEPFMWPFFLELGSIAGFGYGFGHRRTVRPAPANENRPADPADGPDRPDGPAAPANRPASGRPGKAEVLADLTRRLARGERFGSQRELAERYGVAKSTMSDWIGEWEAGGLVPPRRTVGRCKAVAGSGRTVRIAAAS